MWDMIKILFVCKDNEALCVYLAQNRQTLITKISEGHDEIGMGENLVTRAI